MLGAQDLKTVALPAELNAAVGVNVLDDPDLQSGTPRLLLWSVHGLLELISIDGQLLAKADQVPMYLTGIALSPSGQHVAGYAADGTATVWSLPDLGLSRRLDPTSRFEAGSLTTGVWLDDNTLMLADEAGLIQVAQFNWQSTAISITRLAGYRSGEQIATAIRLANGRLLTAGYADGAGLSSLRIWQLDQVHTALEQVLPAATEPLCQRLQRVVKLRHMACSLAMCMTGSRMVH